MAKTTTSSLGFNKRRAQGEDKIDGFKSFPLKIRKLNPVNTISYVQILGTGMDTQDTSPSVLLFFDKQRFIFNVGEGFQRYCTEHKIKLSKIDHILHSRVCSETVGGLPGLLLTLAGMGEQGMSVKLWGPSDLKILINGMLSFIPNDVVHATYFGPAPTGKFTDLIELIDDELVKISAILLRPSCPRISEQNKELSRCLGPLLPHLDNSKGADGTMPKPPNISVIYVCELPEIKGKFDPVKAKDHGLKPGPKYRQLQHGNSVMSDEKNVMIYPNDVLGPSIRGPIVLIVDCPTLHHLQELLSVQSLRNFYSDTKEQNLDGLKSVDCIIHLSPSSVTTTAMYQKWMNRFGGAQHIMAGHQIKRLGNPVLRASATISARLNYLCPRFFPAPGFPSSHEFGNFGPESNGLKEGTVPMLCDTIPAENLMKFHLRPCQQRGLDRSEVPTPLSQEEIINELVSEIPEIVDYKEEVSQLWVADSKDDKRALKLENFNEDEHEYALPHCLKNITREDMEIVLLGTGSSQPSKHRNVSSIYLNLFSNGGLLLDCGEATLAQLIKRYGDTGADKELKKLKCIWISHIHADHHAGLSSILHRRSLSLNGISHEPLLVIGPWQLKSYLDAAKYLNVDFLDCRHTMEASLSAFESAIGSKENWVDGNSEHFKSLNRLKNLVKEAGLEGIISVPVVHCPHAFGIIVKAAERRNRVGETVPGWKLAYSGDTRPCQQLVNAARGATVLIHEATFEDGMAEEAVAKNHSTTKEAIEVGDSAGAYRIILTHFSQRYPKIPVFDDTHMQRTCVAFDLMSINIADLPLLPKVLPYLKSLFQNEMIVDESVS